MAVAFDAVGPSSAGQSATATTTTSWSHTCSGGNRFLTVGVAVGNSPHTGITTSVTYNGVAMTSVGSQKSGSGSDFGYVQMFGLVAPDTGTNTVAVTTSATVNALSCGSVSFTGVNQNTPLGTPVTAASSGSTTTPTVTVTGTVTGNMVVDAACAGSAFSADTQTLQWRRNTNGSTGAGNGTQSTAAAGGSVTMAHTITSDIWGTVAVEVLADDTAPRYVADRGSTANVTAATTSVVTITNPTSIAVGNYLIARVAVDNSGTSGAAPGCTITDTRNTWTVLGPALADPGAASAGSTAYLCYARVVTAYQAADTLTFNWGGISTTAKAIVVEEWRNIHSATPVAVSAVTNNSGTAGSTTAVSVSITPTAPGQLVYTCLATEGIAADTIGADSDTTNGTWATLTTTASADATATNNQRVSGQYKAVTAAGAQSWDSTITSRDWAAIAVVFAPLPFRAPDPRIRRLLPLLVR